MIDAARQIDGGVEPPELLSQPFNRQPILQYNL
jgi:hypothetical protein